MIWAERARQLHLHGLRRVESGVQPLIAIVYENLYNVGWVAAAQRARDCSGTQRQRQDDLCHYRLHGGI